MNFIKYTFKLHFFITLFNNIYNEIRNIYIRVNSVFCL